MRIAAIAALAIITSACSRNSESAQDQAAAGHASNVISQVDALSGPQRNAVFIRAILDAGLECQHVDWSTRSGTYRGMPVWTAACARNQVWIIVVGNDGIAQVLNPAEGLLIYNRLDTEEQVTNGQ